MFKKLLLAGSIAALTTGSAQALDVVNNNTALTPALELSLPGATGQEFETDISVDLDTTAGAFYPTGTTFVLTIDLPANMIFGPAGAPVTAVTGSQPGLVVTPSSGGGAGATSVEYLVSTTSTAENSITFSVTDVELLSCGEGDITMAAVTEAGNLPIDGGSASGTIVEDCESALNHSVEEDFTTPNAFNDTVVLLPTYTNLNDTTVGLINYYIDNAVSIDGLGNPLTLADIDSVTFDVEAGDGVGLQDVTITTDTEAFSGTTASFDFSGANVANLVSPTHPSPANTIVLQTNGTDEVEVQSLDVVNALVTFNDGNADLVDSEPGAEGGIDDLERQGQVFGVFDWNDGRAGRTTSVYRATGFQPGQTFDYEVEMTNSIFAAPNNVFRGTATADIVGEFVMTSVGFGGIVPVFGRGDAEITFEVTETLDVDRLMVRNGISTEFGDGANSNEFAFSNNQPVNDGDNFSE